MYCKQNCIFCLELSKGNQTLRTLPAHITVQFGGRETPKADVTSSF